MKDYTPTDWYWIVAGDETKVFSSAIGEYVQPDNAAYVAWLGRGGVPTRIASEDELGEVLANETVRPTNATVLDKYQDAHAKTLTIKVVAKVLFYMVNEIRTLKGQQPITANQFRNFLKGLM